MSNKKILLDAREAYYQAGGTGQGRFIKLDWISGNIHQQFRAGEASIHITDKSVVYRGSIKSWEITSPNGFDYSVANPDYSVLKERRIGMPESFIRQFKVAFTQFSDRIYLSSIIEQMGAVILDDFLRSREDEWSGHNIDKVYNRNGTPEQIVAHSKNYDVYEEHIVVQPFSYKVETINETAASAGDGIMRVLEAWGGPGTLKYRIATGPDTRAYQVSNEFLGLPNGSYTGQVKDSDSPINKSKQFAFTINTDP